ncbi:ABC transporter permease [Haloechinothrix sp. YIM 98757]|uniref:Transport permease protein n=1 Tax=Haloechinothrix aidingensis TaxID=2752311 RepID=A0A837ZZ98_9PSEU|nr:ABC transporter permease [Haloechinothrix aidingensis]MBA0125936.1 ABC transporter permease [Haloechinothrix aidingensis]
MLLEHARVETLLTLRHGEQLLLTVLIPIALLVALSLLDVLPGVDGAVTGSGGTGARVHEVAPGILALAVLSSAFTGQAIALGFDRKYGVLKRLAATALPRWLLVCGRMVAALVVVLIQVCLVTLVALALGWRPELSGVLPATVLLVAGTAAFGALGVLLGGALRADIVLALANVVWFVLLLAGGILLAPSAFPQGIAHVVTLVPSGALADGLRAALIDGATAWTSLAVLMVWAAAAAAVATRTTRLT